MTGGFNSGFRCFDGIFPSRSALWAYLTNNPFCSTASGSKTARTNSGRRCRVLTGELLGGTVDLRLVYSAATDLPKRFFAFRLSKLRLFHSLLPPMLLDEFPFALDGCPGNFLRGSSGFSAKKASLHSLGRTIYLYRFLCGVNGKRLLPMDISILCFDIRRLAGYLVMSCRLIRRRWNPPLGGQLWRLFTLSKGTCSSRLRIQRSFPCPDFQRRFMDDKPYLACWNGVSTNMRRGLMNRLPRFNFQRHRVILWNCASRIFRGRNRRLISGLPQFVGLTGNRFPRLYPHTLLDICRWRGLYRRFRFRGIGVKRSFRIRRFTAALFLF